METTTIKKTGKAAAKVIARRVLGSGMDPVRPSLTVKKADLKAALVAAVREKEELESQLRAATYELETREAEKFRDAALKREYEVNAKIEKELRSISYKLLGGLFWITAGITTLLDGAGDKLAALGERILEIRARRLERHLPIDERTLPPQHFNCRSSVNPYDGSNAPEGNRG